MIRDGGEGVAHVSCRIIEVLGDDFDFFAFNSEFRVDQQGAGPAHGFAGFYRGNIQAEVTGIGIEGDDTTPCESRLKNSWGYPVWMKAESVVDESHAELPGQTPYDPGLTIFAHEIGHTWLAAAQYMKDGERRLMTAGGGSHWAFELHAPAPFPWWGTENGSVMGGSYWRENSDGTFTPTVGWSTKGGGFSWLDLYLMGLATPNEVPDMFVLHNLKQVGERWDDPYTAEKKEIVTMEQVLAAMGPRNPPPERARKVFNIGSCTSCCPGRSPTPSCCATTRATATGWWSTGATSPAGGASSRRRFPESAELTRSTAAEPVHQGGAAEGPRTADSRRRGSAGTAWNAAVNTLCFRRQNPTRTQGKPRAPRCTKP